MFVCLVHAGTLFAKNFKAGYFNEVLGRGERVQGALSPYLVASRRQRI